MDDGFDPCECIFSHEAAMQRLISLLRSSQSACTDSECFQELPSMQQAAGGSGFFLVMVGWMVLAMVLYYLRPNSLRNRDGGKPGRQVSALLLSLGIFFLFFNLESNRPILLQVL